MPPLIPIVTPLTHFDADLLLNSPDLFPFMFRDTVGFVMGILPRWVISVNDDCSLEIHNRHDEGGYRVSRLGGSLRDTIIERLSLLPRFDTSGFNGGIAGWLGYDLSAPVSVSKPSPDFPKACIAGFDAFIRMPASPQDTPRLITESEDQARLLLSRLSEAPGTPRPFSLLTPFSPLVSEQEYAVAFERVQTYLQAGDCYQVNFAQAFRAKCSGSGIDAFLHLNRRSQPPYAAFLSTPFGDVLSLSPELFLRFEDRRIVTRPIKGTRPRGMSSVDDQQLAEDLARHPKDRAENLMIVDLLRNDLGKHAVTGTVKVNELFSIESFKHVHHLTSEIECRLRQGVHPMDVLLDISPGGSITGAPKKRAMEIIDELESFGRSVYCGSVGYMTVEGKGEWNIAIRTLLMTGGEMFGWAGGGIVADSTCEDEYQECFNKIGPLIRELEEAFLPPSN